MPISDDSKKGTNLDGSKNSEYYSFCYNQGKFTIDLLLDEFIEKQITLVAKKMNVSEIQARKMVVNILSTLKRWKK